MKRPDHGGHPRVQFESLDLHRPRVPSLRRNLVLLALVIGLIWALQCA